MDDLLAVAGLSRSTYYYQLKFVSKPAKYEEEHELIKSILLCWPYII